MTSPDAAVEDVTVEDVTVRWVPERAQPPIVAAFADGNLTLTLPSAHAITYPSVRLIQSRFEDAPPDVEFMDNARGQWEPSRGWFGTFVENVVQETARDLLAAAIDRLESRGIDVVFHSRRSHRRSPSRIAFRFGLSDNFARAA